MSAPERYWKLRLQCGHKEDWFPACHGCLDEADASLADLRSQLREANHQIEGMQAHIDNVIHPDDCNSLWQAQVEDLRSQHDGDRRLMGEMNDEVLSLRAQLEAATRLKHRHWPGCTLCDKLYAVLASG